MQSVRSCFGSCVHSNLERCTGEIFNIGTDATITTGEGMRIVEEIIGKPARIALRPPREGDQLKTQANINKTRRELGYNPATMPPEGLEAQVEWYRQKILEIARN